MNRTLKEATQAELRAAFNASAARDYGGAFHHLERTHILSQRYTMAHIHVHWLMLRLGLVSRSWREVIGQVPRILAAALFSRIWVPAGNTGRANISAFRTMPIPEDLRRLLEASDTRP